MMKQNRRAWAWGLVAGPLLGAGFGWGVLRLWSDWEVRAVVRGFWNLDPRQEVLFLIGSLAALAAVVVIHEAGHLLGARLVGFRFSLFIVGPLRIMREGEGIRVGWNRNLSLAGGIAGATPTPDRLDKLGQRMAVMVACGPATSLMAGGALALVYLWTPLQELSLSPSAGVGGVLARLVPFFAMALLFSGFLSLVPGRSGGFLSDGARLLRLLRGGPNADADIAMLALIAWSTAGTRPRDWDPRLIESALWASHDPFRGAALHIAWRHAVDAGDEATAGAHRSSLLASLPAVPGSMRPAILLDLAVDSALAGDPQGARELIEKAGVGGSLIHASGRLLADAALAAAEGRRDDALAAAEKTEAALPRTLDRSVIAFDLERLERVRAMVAMVEAH